MVCYRKIIEQKTAFAKELTDSIHCRSLTAIVCTYKHCCFIGNINFTLIQLPKVLNINRRYLHGTNTPLWLIGPRLITTVYCHSSFRFPPLHTLCARGACNRIPHLGDKQQRHVHSSVHAYVRIIPHLHPSVHLVVQISAFFAFFAAKQQSAAAVLPRFRHSAAPALM